LGGSCGGNTARRIVTSQCKLFVRCIWPSLANCTWSIAMQGSALFLIHWVFRVMGEGEKPAELRNMESSQHTTLRWPQGSDCIAPLQHPPISGVSAQSPFMVLGVCLGVHPLQRTLVMLRKTPLGANTIWVFLWRSKSRGSGSRNLSLTEGVDSALHCSLKKKQHSAWVIWPSLMVVLLPSANRPNG
jgi:hypothetical protein